MPDPAPARTGWVQPVLLAIATASAVAFAFLYLTRPNPGELGSVRVVVTDDNGKSGNSLHVVVAEAPQVQKEVVSPGANFAGVVHYPVPYLIRPNLKLTAANRSYETTKETEFGFAWVARPRPDDFRDDAKKDNTLLENLLGATLETAAATGKLKSGLVFEDFTWEAKGLRAPLSALPPPTFEQTGTFVTAPGKDFEVFFKIPYASPPNVELTGSHRVDAVITACTARSFTWRYNEKGSSPGYDVTWTAKGVLAGPGGK
jgi:hypothetical protein